MWILRRCEIIGIGLMIGLTVFLIGIILAIISSLESRTKA